MFLLIDLINSNSNYYPFILAFIAFLIFKIQKRQEQFIKRQQDIYFNTINLIANYQILISNEPDEKKRLKIIQLYMRKFHVQFKHLEIYGSSRIRECLFILNKSSIMRHHKQMILTDENFDHLLNIIASDIALPVTDLIKRFYLKIIK